MTLNYHFLFFCDIPEKFQEKKLLISVTIGTKLKMTSPKVSAISIFVELNTMFFHFFTLKLHSKAFITI